MRIVFIGLSASSAWGNGHATTYRALLKALSRQGHEVHFLERDKPWYRTSRDFHRSRDFHLHFYYSLEELHSNFEDLVQNAQMVIVGSFVPEGPLVCDWVQQTAEGVKAFYDIDTPVTLEKLSHRDEEYLIPMLIPGFDLYLSFAGGRALRILEETYGSPMARPLYCSVDTDLYYPTEVEQKWRMGYVGTYSPDRQVTLDELLIAPAKHLPKELFVVAGPGYPDEIKWPVNVARIDHLPPDRHNQFYNEQQLTLNVTRQPMKALGHSPSVRLFEAAACGTPVLSDDWDGLAEIFTPGKEILIAHSTSEALDILRDASEAELHRIGVAARERILKEHTADQRAKQLLAYYQEVSKEVLN